MDGEASRDVAPGTGSTSAVEDESLGRLVRSLHRAYVKALEVRLSGSGVTGGEWSCLRVLWMGDGITQVELARAMGMEKASLTPFVAGLVRKGLLRRTRNRVDRRKLNLHLSKAGHVLRNDLLPAAAAVNEIAEDGLSRAEVECVRRLLGQLMRNLEAKIAQDG